MLLSGPSNTGATTVQYFNPGNDFAASGTYTASEILTINLQTTTSGNWTETYYVDGTEVGTLNDPPELDNYVGFGDLNGSGIGSGDITSFELTNDSVAAVPEPSTWALLFGGLGLLTLWRVRGHRT